MEQAQDALPIVRPGDASVAAPFTSRSPSVRAVVDLIRQGRCTLLSALQQQQIMMLQSLIAAYTFSALSLEGARSSERQLMASNWLILIASLAFS
jgi:cation-transporting ATPase 13A1